MSSPFNAAMRQMRRRNPQVQEDGFDGMRRIATAHVGDLIAEFETEPDHGLRCWLLELIGGTGSPRGTDLLIGQLNGDDESLRDWAVHGLRQVDTHAARTALYRAAANGLIPPRPNRRRSQ